LKATFERFCKSNSETIALDRMALLYQEAMGCDVSIDDMQTLLKSYGLTSMSATFDVFVNFCVSKGLLAKLQSPNFRNRLFTTTSTPIIDNDDNSSSHSHRSSSFLSEKSNSPARIIAPISSSNIHSSPPVRQNSQTMPVQSQHALLTTSLQRQPSRTRTQTSTNNGLLPQTPNLSKKESSASLSGEPKDLSIDKLKQLFDKRRLNKSFVITRKEFEGICDEVGYLVSKSRIETSNKITFSECVKAIIPSKFVSFLSYIYFVGAIQSIQMPLDYIKFL
jgi:hypothetical protein